MKKNIIYILLIFFTGIVGFLFYKFVGFSVFYKRGVSIEALDHRELLFNDLPKGFQQVLKDISDGKRSMNDGSLIVSEGEDKYRLEVAQTGPWIDYSLLIDLFTKKEYRISSGLPHPYVVYEGKLYISKDYNIIGPNNSENIIRSTYYEYMLK